MHFLNLLTTACKTIKFWTLASLEDFTCMQHFPLTRSEDLVTFDWRTHLPISWLMIELMLMFVFASESGQPPYTGHARSQFVCYSEVLTTLCKKKGLFLINCGHLS